MNNIPVVAADVAAEETKPPTSLPAAILQGANGRIDLCENDIPASLVSVEREHSGVLKQALYICLHQSSENSMKVIIITDGMTPLCHRRVRPFVDQGETGKLCCRPPSHSNVCY